MSARRISQEFRQRLLVNYTQWAVGAGFFHSQDFYVGIRDDVSSELTPVLHVIYDCGTHRARAVIEREVDEYVRRHGKDLDLLFISHFDRDHISGLPILQQKGVKAKRVVAPLLDPDERLLAFAKAISPVDTGTTTGTDLEFYGRLVADPEAVLGEVADQVELVDPEPITDDQQALDESLLPEDAEDGMELRLSRTPAQKLMRIHANSPTVQSPEYPIWEFRYHVLRRIRRQQPAFRTALARELGISEACLQTMLANPRKLQVLVTRRHIELRRAYDSLAGMRNRNDTSLCLYSGPAKARGTYRTYRSRAPHGHIDRPEVGAWGMLPGWLGTGDAPLAGVHEMNEFNAIFGARKVHVGTLALPHHGSRHNHRDEIFSGFTQPPTCIVGADGLYGHPNQKVVLAASLIGSTLLPVTAATASRVDESCTIFFRANPRR
ncbi:MBL fold metallo-hydrolase [Brevibacterium ihuae]|uniref:MBL fold metallo-hydrolase n=1 Tax=Brevibacterium ihuae TaxID=1631743 RepID=UPI0011AF4F0E|nr:MBL fold metallo-hydrolase [Brevibacterium ihuae]